jgi:hypothetical protein
MARKQMVTFRADPAMVRQFREAAKPYYGRLAVCFSAALLMFMEADPREQGQFVKRIYDADVNDEISSILEGIRAEQTKRVKLRDRAEKKHQ